MTPLLLQHRFDWFREFRATVYLTYATLEALLGR
jgi:hypothetical protein